VDNIACIVGPRAALAALHTAKCASTGCGLAGLIAEGDLLRPFPAAPMRMWPISTRINKLENDDPSIRSSCLRPSETFPPHASA
jgi:hypothetical protein